jgi:hypothetical protein
MTKPIIAQFIDKVKADKELHQKILAAERHAAKQIIEVRKSNVDAIKQIAQEAGFAIEEELARPQTVMFPQASEIESSCGVIKDTCCYLETSSARPIVHMM